MLKILSWTLAIAAVAIALLSLLIPAPPFDPEHPQHFHAYMALALFLAVVHLSTGLLLLSA